MKAKGTPWKIYILNGLARRLSQLGEKLGQDWLIYNPLVMLQFHRQSLHDASVVVPAIKKAYPNAKQVLDVGSGSGSFAAEFSKKGCHAVALERSVHGRKMAKNQGVDCRPFDLLNEPPAQVSENFDLVYCFEVAEHLTQPMGDRLVEYISQFHAPIVFSAAQPGQGGTGHINEQLTEYWVNRFAKHGYAISADKTHLIRNECAAHNAALWFQKNIIVLEQAAPSS